MIYRDVDLVLKLGFGSDVQQDVVAVAGRRDMQAMEVKIDDVEAGRPAIWTLGRVGRRVIQIVVEMDTERVTRLNLDEWTGQATAVGAKKYIVHDAGAGIVDLVVTFDDVEIERDQISSWLMSPDGLHPCLGTAKSMGFAPAGDFSCNVGGATKVCGAIWAKTG